MTVSSTIVISNLPQSKGANMITKEQSSGSGDTSRR